MTSKDQMWSQNKSFAHDFTLSLVFFPTFNEHHRARVSGLWAHKKMELLERRVFGSSGSLDAAQSVARQRLLVRIMLGVCPDPHHSPGPGLSPRQQGTARNGFNRGVKNGGGGGQNRIKTIKSSSFKAPPILPPSIFHPTNWSPWFRGTPLSFTNSETSALVRQRMPKFCLRSWSTPAAHEILSEAKFVQKKIYEILPKTVSDHPELEMRQTIKQLWGFRIDATRVLHNFPHLKFNFYHRILHESFINPNKWQYNNVWTLYSVF